MSISSFGLVNLQSKLQTTQADISGNTITASTAITQFLSNPSSQEAWNKMDILIRTFITTDASSNPGLRVLITLSDGRVAYDTSKTAGGTNTFARYQAGTINDNHNTRVAILTALLGNSGNGNEDKYSSTTGQPEAYNAIRMGLSTPNSLGCSRVSVLNQ
jgi:hypothetical protein